MPQGWTPTRIGNICKTNQRTYSVAEKWPFVNYLDTGNITENRVGDIQHIVIGQDTLPSRARRKVAVDDIIYSTVRPNQRHYGIVRDVLPNMLVSTGFTVITVDKEKADSDFLYYYLTQSEIVDSLHAIGEQSVSAYPSIKPSDIERVELDLPPLPEQVEIGHTLRALDDKIANNTKINNHLEQMAQAIFKSWFVDFEPFGGVMPDEWREGTFSDIISATIGGDWGKDAPTGNNTQEAYCIRGADIPDVNAGNKGKMPIRYILPKNYAVKQLMVGDIVVEISGGSPTQSTGRCALITQSLLDRYDRGMVCTNFCRAVKPLFGYSSFVYFYWKYLYSESVMFSYENGTTGIKNLDISGFLGTEPIIIPPVEVVHQFTDTVGTLIDTVFANGLENETLATTRNVLLPRLMSGELSVTDLGDAK
ncbi:MAG: restriction endonuclease subunit S [Christensenella sp.]|nr:restriction endonuclease subunit S [Christensenella sp.]